MQTLSSNATPISLTSKNAFAVKMPGDSLDSIFQGLSRNDVFQFYKARNGTLAWNDADGLTVSGDSLFYFIANVIDAGLSRANYHYDEIRGARAKQPSEEIVQRLDALLTDAFLMLAADLKYGATKHTSDTLQLRILKRAIRDGNPIKMLRSCEPREMGYRSLRNAMQATVDSLHMNDFLLSESRGDGSAYEKLLVTMAVNLERWRLDSEYVSDTYIFINVPSFTANIISNDTIVLESRAIVGTPDKPTPDLSSRIECIVTYPYWHVPRKIAVEEFLPQIKKNRLFLNRNNFDVLDRQGNILNSDSVRWETFTENYFPVSLRQREGAENSLGILKFVFDNPYAVYMHDTNAKNLFRNPVRAYSHGCVRIERAEDFAHYLITGNIKMKSKTLSRFLEEREKHNIALTTPMPIYIRYLTSEVKNKKIYLYPDVYKRDEFLLDKLKKRDLNL